MNLDRTLTIYKASAGSGKTYTLALEYIKLLLGIKNREQGTYALNSAKYNGVRLKSRHRHILAITFTNKATAEMKERIVSELNALSHLTAEPREGESKYAAALIGCFGCSRTELAEAAAEALHELLYDYSGFNVSTIDSFFQQILREFAREVDRQGDFEVELDNVSVVSRGVSMMLDDLNYNTPHNGARMQRWIYDYMLDKIKSSKKYNLLDRSSAVFAGLVKFVAGSANEKFQEKADEIAAYLDDESRLRKFRIALEAALGRRRSELTEAARSVARALADEDYGLDVLKYTGAYVEKILAGEEPYEKVLSGKTMANLAAGVDQDPKELFVGSRCRTANGKKNGPKIYPSASVAEALASFAVAYSRCCAWRSIARSTIDALDNLEFLGFVQGYIEQFRRENNMILLSDTNEMLERIIGESDAPFIYERLGVWLQHFLIDEFQDTSRLQWKILRPLVAQGVTDRHDSLIIGDVKQAIYRFRNSDSTMLHHSVAAEDFPGRHTLRGTAAADNTNYRSAPDMVRFNNTLFSRLGAIYSAAGYDGVTQHLPPSKAVSAELPAYISVLMPSKEDKEASEGKVALARMVEQMQRQHRDGYRWCDIAVLVRANSEAAVVVDHLRSQGISVLSEDALYLRNSGAVRVIVSMLKLLDNAGAEAGADTDKAGATQDSMTLLSRYNYFAAEGHPAEEALTLALGDGSGQSVLDDTVRELTRLHATSLTALVDMIIKHRIPAPQRRSEMAFICAFQDMVLDYCKKYPDSLHDFLKWYDTTGIRRTLPAVPDIDAVQVMTIHKAKGLEWDCVHIPFANWEMAKYGTCWFVPDFGDEIAPDIVPPLLHVQTGKLMEQPGVPFHSQYITDRTEQQLDNLNSTYVAFTRAGRELIVTSLAKNVGNDIRRALAMSFDDGERNSGLHLDTASAIGADGCLMEIGAPTVPDPDAMERRLHKQALSRGFELDDYEVYDRDDTREMVAMPDVTIALGKIDDHTDTDDHIVDPIPADSSGDDLVQRREAARRGMLLHAVMAEMHTRNDLPQAMARVANAMAIDPAEADALQTLLEEALHTDDPRIERWFDPDGTLLSEQSILLPGGTVLRPDRIMLHADGSVDLVDYKFTSALRPSHQQQLRDYCVMLREMGYSPVSGHLWYPLLGRIATEKVGHN